MQAHTLETAPKARDQDRASADLGSGRPQMGTWVLPVFSACE
jgi:hypothetical protein